MANNLKHYRLKHRLSVSDLCEQVYGTRHHNSVSKHENNGITTAKAALKYAEALNENVFDILGDDVLLVKPKTQEDKQKLLQIINGYEIK